MGGYVGSKTTCLTTENLDAESTSFPWSGSALSSHENRLQMPKAPSMRTGVAGQKSDMGDRGIRRQGGKGCEMAILCERGDFAEVEIEGREDSFFPAGFPKISPLGSRWSPREGGLPRGRAR
jgi:hypothetical protein